MVCVPTRIPLGVAPSLRSKLSEITVSCACSSGSFLLPLSRRKTFSVHVGSGQECFPRGICPLQTDSAVRPTWIFDYLCKVYHGQLYRRDVVQNSWIAILSCGQRFLWKVMWYDTPLYFSLKQFLKNIKLFIVVVQFDNNWSSFLLRLLLTELKPSLSLKNLPQFLPTFL